MISSVRAGMGFTLGVLALLASAGTSAAARGAQPSIVVTRADTLAGASFEIVGRVFKKGLYPGTTETNEQLEDRSSKGLVGKARALGANCSRGRVIRSCWPRPRRTTSGARCWGAPGQGCPRSRNCGREMPGARRFTGVESRVLSLNSLEPPGRTVATTG